MSQHDYVLDNQSGASFRADLNNALAAVVSQNSGATEPTTMYAFMPWADTTAGRLKRRNAANTGWIDVMPLASSAMVPDQIHAATTKSTPIDADEIGFWDSVSGALRKLTFANLKSVLMAYVGPGPSGNVLTSTGSGWASAAPSGVPVGVVCYFPNTTPPTGFVKANGAALSRTTYAALFAAIGTTFGAGDGITTFNLPDLRGEFIRGLDDGRGVDAGRGMGTAQAQATLAHTHTGTTASAGAHTHTVSIGGPSMTSPGANETGGSPTTTSSAGNHTHTFTTDASTGAETRPRNIALLACIKY